MQPKPLPDYDVIPTPGVDRLVYCKPEVFGWRCRHERRYRAVLVGKRGVSGYETRPVVKLERCNGFDALGNETWLEVSADDFTADMVGAMLLELRELRKFKASCGATEEG
jgi:hypothetical protein